MRSLWLVGWMVVASLAVPRAYADEPAVVRVPVAFDVDNLNRSPLPCATDGGRYTLAGEVVAPVGNGGVDTATLYLHEFSFGSFFWSFDDVPGYDYAAALARAGHVSVVVDRLGYDASGHPVGTETCLGAHADVVAQVVRQLQNGSYRVAAGGGVAAFPRVLLAGHSVGAGVTELATHGFPDLGIAGLLLFGWADQGYSSRAMQESLRQAEDCRGGGEHAEPGGPVGYAYYGRTEADFQANVFHDADPAVVAATTARRNRDPCGDNATLLRMAAINAVGVGEVTVPVLLLAGDEDAVFDAGAAERQAGLFRSSPDVTVMRFAGAGHALALERVAPDVQSAAIDWLAEHAPPGPASSEPGGAAPSPQVSAPQAPGSERQSAGPELPRTGAPVAAVLGVAAGMAAVGAGLAATTGRRAGRPGPSVARRRRR